MKNRKKQFVVFGLGRFGMSLACSLGKMGHEVLAVDNDEEAVSEAAPYVTQAVQADATNEAVLHELDVGSFDAAIIAIGSNIRDSIMITVLCKESGVPQVIAKAVDDLHAKILQKVGADRVVFPEQDMGQRIARLLDAPNIIELMELSEDYRIAEMRTPEKWCGRTIVEVNVRRNYGISVIGVRRNESFIPSPGAEWVFEADDVLLVMGRAKDVEAVD